MRRSEIEGLDPARRHWVPALVSPERDWAAWPGCRRGARFLVHPRTLRPSREEFETFDSELDCLAWIMRNRAELNRALCGVRLRPVRLDRWLLGLD